MTSITPWKLLRLAARQLRRETRSGEVRTLFAALVIAIATSTAIGYFSARLNASMVLRASEFLAADLVLEGSSPATAEQLAEGTRLQLQHAHLVEFSTVIATDEHLQLVSVKAVDSAYPLRGQLRSAPAPYQSDQVTQGPEPGEAWVEPRLLAALDLKIGDHIEVGYQRLRLTRVLTHEPDRSAKLYSLTPRVLMHRDDLAATQIIQPGSRVQYKELWKGESANLERYRQYLLSNLQAQQDIKSIHDGNRQIAGALGRAEQYLNLACLAAILLASVAVALSAVRFAGRRLDACALLRCLGLSRQEALLFYTFQLLLLGLLACAIGGLLGWLGQLGLFQLLQGILHTTPPAGGTWPLVGGMATGLVALAGFALPSLAALGRIPPLRVLRRDLLPPPLSSWIVYGIALLTLALIMWRLSLNWGLTLALLAGGVTAALCLGTLLMLGLRHLRKWLIHAPLAWRLGLGQLLRYPMAAAGQTLAFGLILLAMAIIVLLRGELMETWQDQLPPDAPNHFAINVLPDRLEAFETRVHALSSYPVPFYPVVPGRLVAVNGEPVQNRVTPNSRGERAIRRDLSLTWATDLAPDNRLIAGHWWPDLLPNPSGLPGASVEAKLAESLQLTLGDRLRFRVSGRLHEAIITSLREANWDSFRPNFYVIFQPGALEGLPRTYLSSFHLPPHQDTALVQLSRDFPAVTLVQVDSLLKQLRDILQQVSLAVEYVLLFVMAAGLSVLFAGLQSTLDERVRQNAVLRAIGAPSTLLRQARWAEFSLLGCSSGLLAAIGCELTSWLLYRFTFDLPWHPHPWLLVLPLLGAVLVGVAGVLGTLSAMRSSPLQLLRDY